MRCEVPGEAVRILANPALLRQGMVNLLDNAMEAVGERGAIVVHAAVEGGDATIEVTDSGPGFPTDDMETLVQPFYSTKGRGSGMGLAMVHRVVTDHGGTLTLGRAEPRGARARIVLPGAMLPPAEGPDQSRFPDSGQDEETP